VIRKQGWSEHLNSSLFLLQVIIFVHNWRDVSCTPDYKKMTIVLSWYYSLSPEYPAAFWSEAEIPPNGVVAERRSYPTGLQGASFIVPKVPSFSY
jgi:hypothetical protein